MLGYATGIEQCVSMLTSQDKPEDGVNALDAAVTAYTSIAMIRQHLPASHKITIVIKGSEKFISNSES